MPDIDWSQYATSPQPPPPAAPPATATPAASSDTGIDWSKYATGQPKQQQSPAAAPAAPAQPEASDISRFTTNVGEPIKGLFTQMAGQAQDLGHALTTGQAFHKVQDAADEISRLNKAFGAGGFAGLQKQLDQDLPAKRTPTETLLNAYQSLDPVSLKYHPDGSLDWSATAGATVGKTATLVGPILLGMSPEERADLPEQIKAKLPDIAQTVSDVASATGRGAARVANVGIGAVNALKEPIGNVVGGLGSKVIFGSDIGGTLGGGYIGGKIASKIPDIPKIPISEPVPPTPPAPAPTAPAGVPRGIMLPEYEGAVPADMYRRISTEYPGLSDTQIRGLARQMQTSAMASQPAPRAAGAPPSAEAPPEAAATAPETPTPTPTVSPAAAAPTAPEEPAPDVRIHDSSLIGSHHGQQDMTIYATTGPEQRVQGKLDYSIFNGEVHINHIEVVPEFQRQGVATKMWDQLKTDNPGMKINPGYATGAGAAFLQSVGEAKPTTFREALSGEEAPPTPSDIHQQAQDLGQGVKTVVDKVVDPEADPAGNKELQSKVDFSLQKGDAEAAQAAIDEAAGEEHLPWGGRFAAPGGEPSEVPPASMAFFHDSLHDDALLQQLRAQQGGEQARSFLEKQREQQGMPQTEATKPEKEELAAAVEGKPKPPELITKAQPKREAPMLFNDYRQAAAKVVGDNTTAGERAPEVQAAVEQAQAEAAAPGEPDKWAEVKAALRGERNTLVTPEAAEQARKDFGDAVGNMNLGANVVKASKAMIKQAVYDFERLSRAGSATADVWKQSMRDALGDKVEPFLGDLWHEVSQNVHWDSQVSQRTPSGKIRDNWAFDPVKENQPVSRQSIDEAPGLLGKLQDKLLTQASPVTEAPDGTQIYAGKYPGLGKLSKKVLNSPKAFMDAVQAHMEDNQAFVFEKMPESLRKLAAQWYQTMYRMSAQWADKYGISVPQSVASTAVYSPGTEWNQNIANYHHMGDLLTSASDTPWNREMTKLVEGGKEDQMPTQPPSDVYRRIKGKSLDQLTNDKDIAWWMKMHDMAQMKIEGNNGIWHWSPDGQPMGVVLTKKGLPTGYNSPQIDPIVKMISLFRDGSPATIDAALGFGNKVRGFFNNGLAPNFDGYGDIRKISGTVDTHHVALSWLRPLGQKSPEVTLNFNSSPGSTITGVGGMYPVYLEAMRNAAEEAGMLPNHYQSVVWVGGRQLFPKAFKTAANLGEIDRIWGEVDRGKLTADQARERIFDFAKGFKDDTPDLLTGTEAEKYRK